VFPIQTRPEQRKCALEECVKDCLVARGPVDLGDVGRLEDIDGGFNLGGGEEESELWLTEDTTTIEVNDLGIYNT